MHTLRARTLAEFKGLKKFQHTQTLHLKINGNLTLIMQMLGVPFFHKASTYCRFYCARFPASFSL